MRGLTVLAAVTALAACGGESRFDRPAPARVIPAPLPAPGGPFPVGSLLLDVDDPQPPELLPEGMPRVIEAQVWYPAAPGADGTLVPYLPRRSTADAMIAGDYWARPPETIATWMGYSTQSVLNPLPAPQRGGFPLLLFAPAPPVAVANYSALLQAVASRGFVVIAVAPRVARVDAVRRTAYTALDPRDEDAVRRAADIGLVMRRFIRSSGTVAAVAQAADLTRAGAFGHVTGSEAVLELCAREVVVRRCAAIDGAPTDVQITRGAARPTLALRSHGSGDGSAGASARDRWLRFFAHRGAEPGALFRIDGLDAASPTDAPWVMPDIVRTDADPERLLDITVSIVAAFFASAAEPFAAVDSVAAGYPELLLES